MKVIWTPEAAETFKLNIDYLQVEWEDQVALNFLDRVDEVVETIKSNPEIYPSINKKDNIRRCVIVKQISLYYKIVSNKQIDLLTFWNSYQNPERIKF
jgi:plasmid stabilization system protein ParE